MIDLKKMHDKLFQRAFETAEDVRLFLEIALPEALRKNIRFSTLEIDKIRYVSDHHKDTFADLVVRAKMKTGKKMGKRSPDIDVYILIEHKSKEEKKTPIQLLSYYLPVWQTDMRRNKPPRLIISLVFYHGGQHWSIPQDFARTFDAPEEAVPYLFNFHYLLFDTNDWDFREQKHSRLKKNGRLFTALMLMKAAYRRDMKIITEVFRFWQENRFNPGRELTIFFLLYITIIRDVSLDELKEILAEYNIDGGDLMPSLAQRLMDEGKEKWMQAGKEKWMQVGKEKWMQIGKEKWMQAGKEKGMQIGKENKALDVAEKMIGIGMSIDKIIEVTGLSREKVESLAAAHSH